MDRSNVEFIGFSLCGPEPLGMVHLPWTDGTTVLFGQNGVGKTKILNRLRQVLSGIAVAPARTRSTASRDVEAFFHVRLPDPEAPADRRHISNPLTSSLLRLLDSAAETESESFVDGFGSEERRSLVERARGSQIVLPHRWHGQPVAMLELLARVRMILQGLPDWPDWIDQAEQHREVASQGVLSLAAAGVETPEWEIWMSMVPGGSGPETRREVDDATGRARLLETWMRDVSPHDRVVYALLARAIDLGTASEMEQKEYRRRHADLRRLVGGSAVANRVFEAPLSAGQIGEIEALGRVLAYVTEFPDTWWNRSGGSPLLDAVAEIDHAFEGYVYQDLDEMDWRPIPDAASSGWFDAPSWVPVPLKPVALGSLEGLPSLAFATADLVSDASRRTTSALRGMRHPLQTLGDLLEGRAPAVIDPSSPERFSKSASPYVARLRSDADRVAGEILATLPEIRLRTGDADEWLDGRAVVWEALDGPTCTWHGLEHLSAAQRRWVTLGIDHAVGQVTAPEGSESRQMMIIDEPELALRPATARRVAEGLQRVAEATGSSVVLASHSVEFLGHPGSSLFKVHRTSDGLATATRVSELDHRALDDLAESVDLDFAELLQLVDVFVFVEGEHDKATFEACIGPELTRLAARCVPMRGTHRVNALLEGEMLLRATSAAIVVVFDNIRHPDVLAAAWSEADQRVKELGAEFGTSHFASLCAEAIPEAERTPEETEMLRFLDKALRSGDADRIFPYGVSKADIEMYLPTEPFGAPPGATWDQLREEHNGLKGSRGVPNDFKTWLRDSKEIHVESAAITRAVAQLDRIPGDFTNLLSYIEEVRLSTRRMDPR